MLQPWRIGADNTNHIVVDEVVTCLQTPTVRGFQPMAHEVDNRFDNRFAQRATAKPFGGRFLCKAQGNGFGALLHPVGVEKIRKPKLVCQKGRRYHTRGENSLYTHPRTNFHLRETQDRPRDTSLGSATARGVFAGLPCVEPALESVLKTTSALFAFLEATHWQRRRQGRCISKVCRTQDK